MFRFIGETPQSATSTAQTDGKRQKRLVPAMRAEFHVSFFPLSTVPSMSSPRLLSVVYEYFVNDQRLKTKRLRIVVRYKTRCTQSPLLHVSTRKVRHLVVEKKCDSTLYKARLLLDSIFVPLPLSEIIVSAHPIPLSSNPIPPPSSPYPLSPIHAHVPT
jgi:hypothetical protein